MQILLATILSILFLIPGLLFRRFYYSEEFSKQYKKTTQFEIVINAFLPSLALYSAWCVLVYILPGYSIDYDTVFKLISNNINDKLISKILASSINIIFFHISLFGFAIIIGFFLKHIVRGWRLDRKVKLFRFNNYWHYIFKGEFYSFKRSLIKLDNKNVKKADITTVDILVCTNNKLILYVGFLVDYELSQDHSLNLIYLSGVKRKFVAEKEMQYASFDDNDFYTISGDIFILRYKEVINMNLNYFLIKIINNQPVLEQITTHSVSY